MSIHPPTAQVRALAAKLLGTIGEQNLRDAIEELSTEDCVALDRLVFECTQCGWWCDENEKNEHPATGDWLCDECYRDFVDEPEE